LINEENTIKHTYIGARYCDKEPCPSKTKKEVHPLGNYAVPNIDVRRNIIPNNVLDQPLTKVEEEIHSNAFIQSSHVVPDADTRRNIKYTPLFRQLSSSEYIDNSPDSGILSPQTQDDDREFEAFNSFAIQPTPKEFIEAKNEVEVDYYEYHYIGVVASKTSNGYYVYCSDFVTQDNPFCEALLTVSASERMAQGTWLNFDIGASRTPIITQYKKIKSIYFVKPVRNSIEMLVVAKIPSDYNIKGKIVCTEYVPQVFDLDNRIMPDCKGKTVQLSITRGKFPRCPLPWIISSVRLPTV